MEPLTMLIGRNGSGKSNTLDALSLLALLASDRTLTDLDRDDPEVAGLRGGLSGCAPYGQGTVSLGADIDLGDGLAAALDIELDPEHFEVVSEHLRLRGNRDRTLIEASLEETGSGLVTARVYSGGAPRSFQMPANRMVAFQAATRVPEDTKSRRLVVDIARKVTAVLAGVFVLDPVPSSMRHYVRAGPPADRTGSSLSSQLRDIQGDHRAWERLLDLVRGLVGSDATQLTFAEGRFPTTGSPVDVMVALQEVGPEGDLLIPASTMSDGTSRYLATLAALLTIGADGTGASGTSDPGSPPAARTVVIEEVENGLFPDQASRVLTLLREEASSQGITLVTTTHSPALLDAVQPEDPEGIVAVQRDERSHSRLTPLTEHENYLELVQTGQPGQAVTRGVLTTPAARPQPGSPQEPLA